MAKTKMPIRNKFTKEVVWVTPEQFQKLCVKREEYPLWILKPKKLARPKNVG
jgi:hypothetical protein